jgi:hypothetical protein
MAKASLKVTISKPPEHPNFVRGSRPPDLIAPRIKPLTGQTQYGKQASAPQNPGFNDTGMSGES